jgi:hypothetical protein
MSLPTYPLVILLFDCAGDSICLLLRTILVSCCLILSAPPVLPKSIILFVCSFSLIESIIMTSFRLGDLKLLLFGTEEYATAVFSTDLGFGPKAFFIIWARRLDPRMTLEEGRSAL